MNPKEEPPEESGDADDRTRVVSTASDRIARDRDSSLLPIGSQLAEFEVTRVVGQGGFGVVYEAWDPTLERVVAIKEYLPTSLSTRQGDGTVVPLSERHRDTFDLGMRSFINEARLLAQFDHPSLLKVYRFWQERGTTYMVMPFYRGDTLRQALAARPGGVDEGWLLRIMDGVTQALAVMHAANCFHRDIAPDNIILLEGSGRPVVLDFGAARRVITDKTQAITVILKPGYAPIEQYAEMPDMSQGAWTDVYALAAVMHVAVSGRPPPPSVARLLADSYQPLAHNEALRQRFSPQLLATIDAGLAVRPEGRPQSMAELRTLLGLDGEETVIRSPGPAAARLGNDFDGRASASRPNGGGIGGIGGIGGSGEGVEHALPPVGAKRDGGPDAIKSTVARRVDGQPVARGRKLAMASVLLVLFAVAAAGWWWMRDASDAQGPRPALAGAGAGSKADASTGDRGSGVGGGVSTGPSGAGPGPGPGGSTERDANVTPGSASAQSASQPNPASTLAASTQGNPSAGAGRSRTPAESLLALTEGAAPGFDVSASPRKSEVVVGKDKLGFELRSKRAGYVYVYLLSSGGEMFLLFPNLLDKYNKIAANTALALPRASWPMDAGGPPGINRFAVLVSEHERDFGASGIQNEGVFPQFPLPVLAAMELARGTGPSPLLGRPICPTGAACNDVYGVAHFQITER